MKNSILYLMTAAVLLAGCAKEVDKTQVPEIPAGMHAVTIIASVDNPETRTSVEIVNKKGIYSWQENEQIAVVETLTEDENGILPFQILDQENGTFTGSMTDGESLVFAVTPKGALTDVECTDETDLTFVLSLSGAYNFSDGTNAVMVAGLPTYAEGSENPHFTFQHAAALYRVVYENVPVGTAALHFVANGKPITGDFMFDSLEGVEMQSEANPSGDDSADVLLDTPVSSPNTTLTFYVPVPTGTYADVTVSLLDEELDAENPIANTTRNFEAADYSVSKGQIVRIPKITLAQTVAPAGTILFSEPFTGFEANAVPVAPGTGATVYNNAVVTYSCKNGGTDTKVYNDKLAGGESPELLVSKSGGSFTISGIPTGGNTTLTVSWYSNNANIDLYDGDEAVSRIAGQEDPYQVVLTVPEGASAINVCFKNTKSSNGRLDNIVVTAGAPLLPAGLTFETSEVQAILGEDFVEPALANEHGLSVTYASSDPDVAEVDSEGNVTVKAIGDATITVSSEPTEEYAQGQASYTIHVAAAVLTIDATTNPVKAECKVDATVTFGVQSNIEWVPSVEEDVNDIVKNISVNEENTVVTVTFNKNEDAQNEKTAVIAITPANEVHAALKKTITVTQEKFMNVDVLTYAWTGITDSGYKDWSGVKGTVSDAVYAGNSNAGVTYIQLRNNNPSGIVTTASGGVVRKVEIDWSTSQNTTNGRYVTVYGRNTAYEGPADLYSDTTRGTSLGTIVKGTSTELTINGDYAYVGLLANGALYMDEIRITWGTVDPNAPKFGASIDGDADIAADVTTGTVLVTGNVAWNASADNGATVSPSSGNGEGTITVTMPENESFTDPAVYVVTVSTEAEVATKTYELTFTQAPAVDPNQNDGTLDKPYNATDVLGLASATGVYVAGTVKSVTEVNTGYGNATYVITDGTSDVTVYRGKYLNNTAFTSADQIKANDEVIIFGNVGKYQNVSQLSQNNYLYSLNGVTTLPTIAKTNITGVSKDGATATTSVTFTDGSGWTASVTPDGTVVTAASISGNTITYTVSQNTGAPRNGSITVTLSRNGFLDMSAVISVEQEGAITSNEVTYTQQYAASGNKVTTTGSAPEGSSCSWTTTYTNSSQLTGGNSMTYTLTGYAGKTITGLTLHLKTNASKGTGAVSMKHGNTEFGTYSIPVIGGTYTDKEATVTATTIGENETVTVTISAEVNSVYCDHITITWN